VTLAVPREHYRYAKPLMGKENLFFVTFFYQISDISQAESLLNRVIDDMPQLATAEDNDFCPNICSLVQICKLLGIGKQMAYALARQQILVRVGHDKFHRDKSTTNYTDYQRKIQRGDSTYNDAKLKQKLEQAKALEISNLVRMKKLVNAEETQRLIESEYAELKKKLNNFIYRLPPLLEDKKAADIFEMTKGEMDECLIGFTTPDLSRVDRKESETGADASAKPKTKRMGRQKKGAEFKNKRRTRPVANKKNSVS
jgi:hypothetical protein